MIKQHGWIFGAALAAFCFAGCGLIVAHLSKQKVNEQVIVGGMFGFSVLLGIVPTYQVVRKNPSLLRVAGIGAALIGISAYCGNILQVFSIQLSPNPGYPSSVIGSQIVVVSLAAAVFLRRPLALRELIGVVMCSIGLGLVSL